MTDVFRTDSFILEKVKDKLDENGFLVLKARPTRAGVFTYRFDGKIVRELRHPDDVFDSASMQSLAMKPFTLFHEGEILTAETFRDHTHGTTGENIARVDGDYLECNISIQDQKAIDIIIGQDKTKLSAGYICKIEEIAGKYKGVRYDQRQRNIRYNHVTGGIPAKEKGAISARGGDGCEFRFDQTFEQIDKIEREDSNMLKKEAPSLKIGKGEHMVRLDSMIYEETPEIVKLLGQRTTLAVALKDAHSRLDLAESDLEQKKASEEQFKKDLEERFDTNVKERSELEAMADEIKIKDFGKLNNKEIKKAICLAENSEIDEKRFDSDDYLAGQFDPIKANWGQVASRQKTKKALKFFNKNKSETIAGEEGEINYMPEE